MIIMFNGPEQYIVIHRNGKIENNNYGDHE